MLPFFVTYFNILLEKLYVGLESCFVPSMYNIVIVDSGKSNQYSL